MKLEPDGQDSCSRGRNVRIGGFDLCLNNNVQQQQQQQQQQQKQQQQQQ